MSTQHIRSCPQAGLIGCAYLQVRKVWLSRTPVRVGSKEMEMAMIWLTVLQVVTGACFCHFHKGYVAVITSFVLSRMPTFFKKSCAMNWP